MTGHWLTFDCYGTLIDWHDGMTRALEQIAPGRSAELIAAYHDVEHELENTKPFLAYRDVQTLGLRRAAEHLDIGIGRAGETVLADTLPTWQPWDETIPALQRLRDDGWKLAILSNVDRASIDMTLSDRLTIAFDDVIAADEVRSYKPDLAHFELFRARHDPVAWVHVGISVFHDIRPIHRLGRPGILIDRHDSMGDATEADACLSSLTFLPDAVKAFA